MFFNYFNKIITLAYKVIYLEQFIIFIMHYDCYLLFNGNNFLKNQSKIF